MLSCIADVYNVYILYQRKRLVMVWAEFNRHNIIV